MSKTRLLKAGLLPLLAFGAFAPVDAVAESLFAEDFEYEAGSQLYKQGGWLKAHSSDNTPIVVRPEGLTHPVVRPASKGGAASLDFGTASSNQRLHRSFSGDPTVGKYVEEGAVYYSLLVNLTQAPTESNKAKSYPFFGLIAPSTMSGTNTDGTMGSLYAALAAYGDASGYYIGANKSQRTSGQTTNFNVTWNTEKFAYGTTHHVVVKYEFVAGSSNDIVTVWIDPADISAEPATATLSPITTSNDAVQNKISGVSIYQGASGSYYSPKGSVDAIRVATSWAELFDNTGSETPDPNAPKLTVSEETCDFGEVKVGSQGRVSLAVKGENLKDNNISVSLAGGLPFRLKQTSLSASLAQSSANGVYLDIDFLPTAAGDFTDELILTCGDAVTKVPLNGKGIADAPLAILPSEETLSFGDVTVGETKTLTLNVKATSLKTDITVLAYQGFSVSTSSIPAAQAMSDAGYDLQVTFSPTEAKYYTYGIILSTTGAYKTVQASGTGVAKVEKGISVNPSSVVFNPFNIGGENPVQNVIVKASGIDEDITVTCDNSNFTISPATIPVADATSENGATLSITYKPAAAGQHLGAVTLTSGDTQATVSLTATAVSVPTVKTAAALQKLADGADCIYSGKATVTYVDAANNKAYAQDVTGGLCLDFVYHESVTVKPGDKITDINGFITKSLGANSLVVLQYELSEQNVEFAPLQIAAADILENPFSYLFKLVTVSNVDFGEAAGGKFSATAFTRGTSDGTAVAVKPFAGTTAVNADVPAVALAITGIQMSSSIVSLSPRSAEDIVAEAVGEPKFTVTYEQLFNGECAPINTDTEIIKATVVAENLKEAATVSLSGANRNQFKLSTETIAAGSSTTEVIVYYHPTAIGKHTGRVNFEVVPTELSEGKGFTFMSYDPQNAPAVEVDPSTLTKFQAAVGEKQEQELVITGKNLPDNGTIKVMGEGQGAFIISSTLLSKYGKMTLKITFQPKAEGDFTERIELKAPMCDPIYVTVTGTTSTGPKPEEKEGDDLPLSAANPLTLLTENFTTTINNNKALSLEGWKNVALQGKRAFWAYDGAAKVTAYDSNIQPGEGTPMQTMLVTPALDFKNSATKLFTFTVKGENLRDDQTDNLEVCYIDLDGTEMYVEPIKGLNIPAIADLNGETIPYVLNFEGQDLADVFFIGFRFTSTRGRDNSAVYFIDDVTYGRTDVPFITPDRTEAVFEANQNTAHTETFAIKGENLTGNIKVEVTGANKSKFSVSPATLPAEGGNITVTFLSEEIGIHEAEILLSAEGAPTTAILLTADNKITSSAIDEIGIDEAGDAEYYNLQGIRVAHGNLVPGIYIRKDNEGVKKVYLK